LIVENGDEGGKPAKHIARGAKQQTNLDVMIRQVPDIADVTQTAKAPIPEDGAPYCTLDELANCSGLALGSPSYFGGIASPLKYFLDQTSMIWMSGQLANKPASVFTSASTMHGGQEMCLQALMTPLFHHGMIIHGLSYKSSALHQTTSGGTPYGASHFASSTGSSELSKEEGKLCHDQGERLAKLCKALLADN
jgi:NAD(P)H dehydrogenase (quinone)